MCRCEFSMDTHIHSVSLFFPFSFSLNTNFFFVLLALSLCILAVHCYFVLDFFFLDASCFCTLPTPQYAMECILTERWSIQCHDILMLPSTCIFLLYCFFFFLFKYSVFFFSLVEPQNWSNTLDGLQLEGCHWVYFFGGMCENVLHVHSIIRSFLNWPFPRVQSNSINCTHTHGHECDGDDNSNNNSHNDDANITHCQCENAIHRFLPARSCINFTYRVRAVYISSGFFPNTMRSHNIAQCRGIVYSANVSGNCCK